MRLKFSVSAVRGLTRLREFIAIHNPKAAKRVSLRLREKIEQLLLHPDLGYSVPELKNVRELVVGNYVVRYLRLEDEIFILRIWHGKEFRDF